MRVPLPTRAVAAVASPDLAEITATFLSRRAFLASASVGSEVCTLLVASATGLPPKARVAVRVRFADDVMSFEFCGTVAHTDTRRGTLVEVTGRELQRFGELHAYVRGVPLAWGRRASERIPVSLGAELTVASGGQVRGLVRDLSRGGACMVVRAARVDVASQVQLVCKIGLVKRLRADGAVAWTSRRGEGLAIGIEFGTMAPSDRLALNSFLLDRRGAR